MAKATYYPTAGEHIETTASRMHAMFHDNGEVTVKAVSNRIKLEMRSGMQPNDIVEAYLTELNRRAAEYRNKHS